MIFNAEVKHTDFLKKAFVVLLREAFKLPSMPAEFRYTEKEHDSHIFIYITYPIRAEQFPMLRVSVGPEDYSVRMFEDEIIEENKDGFGEIVELKRVAPIITPVIVRIGALTTQDRDRLTDIVSFLIRRIFRDRFAKEGIAYTGIEIGGDQEESWFNQVVYTKDITVKCYTEVQDTVPQDLINAINDVVLTDVTIVES